MPDTDQSVGDVQIFGIAFRRLTLIRIAGGCFALMGILHLVEAFFRGESVVWWKLVLGAALLAVGVLCLLARAADTKKL